MTGAVQVAFHGTKDEQELAARAFDAIKRKYPLYAVNAPMKMTLSAIVENLTKAGAPFAGSKQADLGPRLEAALRANPEIFTDMGNGEFATTKGGHAPTSGGAANAHTFKERLNLGATQLDATKAEEYRNQLQSQSSSRAEKNALLEDVEVEEAPVKSVVGPAYPPLPTTPYSRSTERPTLIPQAQIVREQPPEPPEPAVEAPVTPAAPPTPRIGDLISTEAPPTAATSAAVPTTPVTPATSGAVPATPTTTPTAPTTLATPATQAAKPATRPEEETPARRAEAQPQPQVPAPTAGATAAKPVETGADTPAAATPREQAAAKPTAPSTQAQPSTPTPTSTAPTTPTTPVTPAAPPTPVARPAVPTAPAAPVITGPVEVTFASPDGAVTVDLNQPLDDILLDESLVSVLAGMINTMVENDSRLIRFGADIFPEEATDRFSKGDFRRIKEYLEEPETGGVASDRDIIADVLGRRIEDPLYERLRFSLDYRLLKEKKDFEFVGVDSDRLWVNANASPVLLPTTRKPAEIGQDYRYLEDPAIIEFEQEDENSSTYRGGPLEYSLSYYEYEHGVLPYDMRFKRIFPGAVFEDQRASLLRFEVPQLFGSLLAELRYPTGNRGGFIMGLNELFTDHLVPGAKFTITPTDRGEDVFEIHFTRAEEEEANLLQLDERKGRWVFRPVQFAVGTDPAALLTQEKFGKLHNHKKLEDADRRKADVIVANAFEAVGETNDGKLWAILEDLYPVVNLDRPMSRSWLRATLSGAHPFFYPDETTEGAYFYDASKR